MFLFLLVLRERDIAIMHPEVKRPRAATVLRMLFYRVLMIDIDHAGSTCWTAGIDQVGYCSWHVHFIWWFLIDERSYEGVRHCADLHLLLTDLLWLQWGGFGLVKFHGINWRSPVTIWMFELLDLGISQFPLQDGCELWQLLCFSARYHLPEPLWRHVSHVALIVSWLMYVDVEQ